MEQMIDTWNEREHSIESASVEWTAKRVITANMQRFLALVHESSPPPLEDTIHTQNYRLVYDGTRMRYDISPKFTWATRKSKYVTTSYLSAFDGEVAKLFVPNNAMDYPSGTIFRDRRHQDIDNTTLIPILLALRPYGYGHPEIAFSADSVDYNWILEDAAGEGRIRLRLQLDGRRLFEVWIDSQANFRAVKFELSADGRISTRCRIKYGANDNSFIPSGWIMERFGRGEELFELYDVQVTKAELNPALAPGTFEIEFPVGTYVADLRTDERYIVRGPNTVREVLPSELRHLSYDVIVATEPGEGLPGKGSPSGRVVTLLWIVLSMALLGLAAIVAWKRVYYWKTRET